MWRVILRYLISFGLIALSPPLVHAATPQEQYRKAISVLVGGSDHQSDMDDAARLLRIAADSGYSLSADCAGLSVRAGHCRLAGHTAGN